MKFAIYGDSFVDGDLHDNHNNYNDSTWATLLAQRLGATAVDHYGHGGSPFYWTYQQVLSTAHNYDRIIVAVTEPMRFPVKVNGVFVTGIHNTTVLHTSQSRRNLTGWFLASDFDYLSTVQDLFIADLARRFPNTVFVPCFPSSFSLDRKAQSPFGSFSLVEVNLLAKQLLGIDSLELPERSGKDQLLCHIPWSWHRTLADFLFASMSGSSLDLNGLVWPQLLSVDNYYLRS